MRQIPLMVAGVVSCLVGIAAADRTPPVATLHYSLNGSETIWVQVDGDTNPDGMQHYVSSAGDESWSATCDVTAHHQADPVATLSGIVTVQNTSTEMMTLEWGIDVPICPGIENGSLVGGVSVLTFTAVDGGSVGCLEGVPMVRSMTNTDEQAGELFSCPTWFYTSGDGTITYITNFGTPMPSAPGPENIQVIGQREQFVLTEGDSVKIQFTFVYKKDNGPPNDSWCVGDLDGDGSVGGADLAGILTAWGTTDPCAANIRADLNGDGIVDGADLAMVLDAWGTCE
jgi:hypothetical protein